ncbi:MAG: ATP-binding protein [Thermoguttaceae bacterium]|nr:ATP-binding protein [Thermoguttaceae bacterium]
MSPCAESPTPPVWKIDQTFPSICGKASQLIDEVLRQMTERGWGDRDIFAVNMALEESVANAIEHGNHSNPKKHFQVICSVSEKLVSILVRDEGKGFRRDLVPNPLDDENLETPSGRGTLLIQGFMTRVRYNDAGNEITMEKEPTPAP